MCHTEVPAIAALQSNRSGWEVGGTGRRLRRNSDNPPDAQKLARGAAQYLQKALISSAGRAAKLPECNRAVA